MDTSSYTYTLQLLLAAVLLLALAFFWGAETALFAANRLKLQNLREKGSRRAGIALDLVSRPARLLSTVLISNNIVNAALVVIATMTLVVMLGPQRGALAAFVFATFLLIVVEIVSKSVAAHHADGLSLVAARPVLWLSYLLTPLIRVFSFITNLLIRPFGARVQSDAPLVTSEEIRLLARMGEEQGVLEQEEREMIHSIIAFGDTVVREVMVPRVDMIAVEADRPIEAVLEVVRTHGHSRIPVFDDNLDNIVGVVYVKDLLAGSADIRLTGKVRDYMRAPLLVPETNRLDDLFGEMRRKKVHMAIAVDEYGGTAGLVTIEDLLEEIVGPIQDEYDAEEAPIKQIDDRIALVDGRVHLEEVNAALDLALPAGEVDTVGGLVYSLLGHMPSKGERVSHNGVEIAIERVDGRRIAQVRITKPERLTHPDD